MGFARRLPQVGCLVLESQPDRHTAWEQWIGENSVFVIKKQTIMHINLTLKIRKLILYNGHWWHAEYTVETIGYDTKTKEFTYNIQILKLFYVNYYKYLQVADPTTFGGFKKFSCEEYIYDNHVFRYKTGI